MKEEYNIDLEEMREHYTKGGLSLSDVMPNPILQFQKWMNEAVQSKIVEPNAMVLSTIGLSGTPNSRVVLLKDIIEDDLIFYTNYDSEKANEIDRSPQVALNFLWKDLQRQVRIVGVAQKTSREISQAYFQKRPRGSQIGAWVSPQSDEIESRALLTSKQEEIELKFKGISSIPLPPNWGGYSITPINFEFWQGRPSRLHDRLRYVKKAGSWKIVRLAP